MTEYKLNISKESLNNVQRFLYEDIDSFMIENSLDDKAWEGLIYSCQLNGANGEYVTLNIYVIRDSLKELPYIQLKFWGDDREYQAEVSSHNVRKAIVGTHYFNDFKVIIEESPSWCGKDIDMFLDTINVDEVGELLALPQRIAKDILLSAIGYAHQELNGETYGDLGDTDKNDIRYYIDRYAEKMADSIDEEYFKIPEQGFSKKRADFSKPVIQEFDEDKLKDFNPVEELKSLIGVHSDSDVK